MADNQTVPQADPVLHPATRMGPVTLAVADLGRSVDFYSRVLGMQTLSQQNGAATMGVGSTPLLYLQEQPGAQRQPARSTGLYHVAVLVPSRPDLGRVILSLAREQYPISGFGDHYVSEAMYLDDPDGNGLEIYRDRPRDEWRWQGTQVVMGTEPVDVDGVIASVEDPDAPFAGMPEGTTIGHVHLKVKDITQSRGFYHGVLGFDVMAQMPSALFISAGRYHHHLGMNTWHSRGAPPPPADSVGLREYTILVPDAAVRDQMTGRLDDAGMKYQRQAEDVLLDDPSGIRLRITPESA